MAIDLNETESQYQNSAEQDGQSNIAMANHICGSGDSIPAEENLMNDTDDHHDSNPWEVLAC